MKYIAPNHKCIYVEQVHFINETPDDLRTERIWHCNVCKRDLTQAELNMQYIMKQGSRPETILQNVLGDNLEK